MNFLEAWLKARYAVRRKDKPSHVGSHGTGWVDKYYILGRCCMESRFYDIPCPCPHLAEDDLKADDWEAE